MTAAPDPLREGVERLAEEWASNTCSRGGCGACNDEIHYLPRLRALLAETASAVEGVRLTSAVCTDPNCTIKQKPGRPKHGPHDFRAGPHGTPPAPHGDDTGARCGLCEKPATGLASIGDTRYCHGDGDIPPTCYEVVQWRLSQSVSLDNLFTPRVPFGAVEVTEAQRDAWKEGWDAGCADAQGRGHGLHANPYRHATASGVRPTEAMAKRLAKHLYGVRYAHSRTAMTSWGGLAPFQIEREMQAARASLTAALTPEES